MPRRLDKDYPGAWLHVGNKGVDGMDIFTCDRERIRFLVLLACAVRKGWIEVHAFCLMSNHFHLLVRSPHGDLARAMHWIEDSYARWFNVRHGRRGPLFTGRYWSKLIHTLVYRRATFGYIHANPERAGVAVPDGGRLWSSKERYATGRGCPWLSNSFGRRLPETIQNGAEIPVELVESWLEAPNMDVRELDELLRQTATHLAAWLTREAGRADGADRPRFLVRPVTVRDVLAEQAAGAPNEAVRINSRMQSAWRLLGAGMLRTLSGRRYGQIADVLRVSRATAISLVHRHLKALCEAPAYASLAGCVLEVCLRRDYASLGDGWTASRGEGQRGRSPES